ncbi:MAG: hypothetical protein Q8Q76_02965 [Methylotenera sp.]|nr:hypothetical protein [Methylotenera sp.]
MQDILNYFIFGNAVLNYLTAFGVFIGGVAVVYVFKKYILGRLKKFSVTTDTLIDDFLISSIEKFIIPIIYFVVFYIALHTLRSFRKF